MLFPRLQKRGPIEAWQLAARRRRIWRFPRLQKRGPIEAYVVAGRSCVSKCPFPRLQKRGPIEAESRSSWFSFCPGFPRLQKRGPIEAITATDSRLSFLGFHAYKSVAPLKRHSLIARNDDSLAFPRLQKRGPIEALLRDERA